MHFRRSCFLLAVGFTCSSVAATTIVPISQDRSIAAGNESIAAPDFGVFDANLGSAWQFSYLEPLLIHGEGGATVSDAVRGAGSHCAVTFALDAQVEYRFQGDIHGSASTAAAFSTARLSGPDGIVREFLAGPGGQPWDRVFDVSGVLTAGQYTLMLDTSAFNGDPVGGFATGGYNGSFSIVPEPASTIVWIAGLCLLRTRRRPRGIV